MNLQKLWKTPIGRVGLAIAVMVVIALVIILGEGSTAEYPSARVRFGEFVTSLTETGELRATNSTVITTPPIRSNLQIVYLAPKGEAVEKGDTLVIFDGTDLQTKIEEKESELEIARANLEKSRASMASNIAQLEASLKSSEASYRQAELRLQQMQFEADVVKEEQELALLQAKINLEQSKERLLQQMKIDSAEVRTLLLRENQAQADVDKAKRDLARATVLAPQPGLVVYKKIWKGGGISEIKVGDSPWRGQALIELPDLSQMEVTTSVNEVDVAKVEAGQKAEIILDAFPDRKFSGTVVEVSNLARTDEEATGDIKVFDVVIRVDGRDPILKPGMTVSATIMIEKVEDALSIPIDAVFNDKGGTIVYRKAAGGFKPVEVKLGLRNDNFVIVEEGLKDGERVSIVDPTKPFDSSLLKQKRAEESQEEEGLMKAGPGENNNKSKSTRRGKRRRR